MNKQLPDYPSELLQLALDDIAIIKEDKRYKINFRYWHKPSKKTCSVDLVGAVLANTLKLNRDTSIMFVGQAEEYIGKDNLLKMLIICSLSQICLYIVYDGYKHSLGQKLTDSEEMLISKIEDKIDEKLCKITPKNVHICKFTDFKKSHDFYKEVVEDLVYLDKIILGMG